VAAPINIKINGVAIPVNQQVMDSAMIINLLYEVITDEQKKEYEETLELNTAYTLPGVGSFRISAFRQKGSPAVVVRYIPGTIPPFDSLNLPPYPQGNHHREAGSDLDGWSDRIRQIHLTVSDAGLQE